MSALRLAATGVPRRLFRNLVMTWALLVCLSVLLVMIFSGRAMALEPLPVPLMAREVAAPEIRVFAQLSQVPSQGLVADRCQSFLKDVTPAAAPAASSETRSFADGYPTRRPAGATLAKMAPIAAIKAYRQCRSQSAKQELAVWSW